MKIKINPLFFVTLFLCCFFGNSFYFFITYISLILHEFIHLFFLYKEKVSAECITLEPFGISIKTKTYGKISPVVYLSAPFFNIFIAFLFYIISKKTGNDLFLNFSASNFALGCFNLIPILPFDGGRAVMCIIKRKNFFVFLSFLGGIFILFTGILFIKSLNFNFSLIMIGIFIIANSFSEREQLFEKSVIINKNRFERKITEKMFTEFLTVPYNYSAHKLLNGLDSKYFYMINIIKDGVIISTIPETTLIEGIIKGKNFLSDFI